VFQLLVIRSFRSLTSSSLASPVDTSVELAQHSEWAKEPQGSFAPRMLRSIYIIERKGATHVQISRTMCSHTKRTIGKAVCDKVPDWEVWP
jgi:hypothetical protein